jgi:membrane-bound lytic murein transglycosylase B
LDGQTAEVFERRLTPTMQRSWNGSGRLSGMLDGDPGLDRAMGPMQFIPET